MALRLRRGTDAERLLTTPVEGELIYTTDTKLLYVGDGTTAGGIAVDNPIDLQTTQLNGLTDVDTTGLALNDMLQYDGANFVPKTIQEVVAGGGALTINTVGTHTGNVIGTLDGDITGSVFADDSTLIIDGLNGDGHFNSIISTDPQLNVGRATGITELRLESFQTRNRFNINTVDKTGDLSGYTGYYGTLNFGFEDATTDRSDCTIRGRASDMRIAHDTVTEFISDETKYFTLKEGNFGFGTYSPAEKLDVRGNIVATGTIQPGVYADAAARDAALTAPTAGQMVYITDVAKFQGNTDGTITGWANLN